MCTWSNVHVYVCVHICIYDFIVSIKGNDKIDGRKERLMRVDGYVCLYVCTYVRACVRAWMDGWMDVYDFIVSIKRNDKIDGRKERLM